MSGCESPRDDRFYIIGDAALHVSRETPPAQLSVSLCGLVSGVVDTAREAGRRAPHYPLCLRCEYLAERNG